MISFSWNLTLKDRMETSSFTVYCLFMLTLVFTCKGHQPVYFQHFCINESNPSVFPSNDELSAGSILMVPKSKDSTTYEPGLNCSVTFIAKNDFSLLITFSNVSLRNTSLDNLTIVYNNDRSEVVLAGQQVCSNEDCEGLKFESGSFRNITLKFISANITVPKNITGFKAIYTVFDHADTNTGACHGSNRFMCQNSRCIWNKLVCDGHNNCGDRSDEVECNIPISDTVWGIVVIVIAIISLIIFVPLFCFLAIYGTKSIVKSVTLPSHATPLYPTVEGGETSGLLTSSQAVNECWPSTSYERRHSYSYGAFPPENSNPPVTESRTKFKSFSENISVEQNNPL